MLVLGMPLGNKYIYMAIEPRYVVVLTRVAGKMKIAYLMPDIGD
jgi:hypothetical protein